jgi:hypothetical protein
MRQSSRTSGRYWSWRRRRRTAVMRSSGWRRKGWLCGASKDALGRVEVKYVGRRLVLPDQHDRAAELLVGGLDQVAQEKLLRPPGRASGQAGRSAGRVRRPCSRPGRPPIRGGGSGPGCGPAAGGRRRHRESGLVLEDEPGVERRHGPSTLGQVPLPQPTTAVPDGSIARWRGPGSSNRAV